MKDTITELNAPGKRLTKLIKKKGKDYSVLPADKVTFYKYQRVYQIENIRVLWKALLWLLGQYSSFIIRGILKPLDSGDYRRKKEFCLDPDPPKHILIIDFDLKNKPYKGWKTDPLHLFFELIAEYLPPEFLGCSFVATRSSSQGIKNGNFFHLAFWLHEARTGAELKRLFANCETDLSVLNVVQPVYTASPIFENCQDPLESRCFFYEGSRDEVHVSVPEIKEEPRKEKSLPPHEFLSTDNPIKLFNMNYSVQDVIERNGYLRQGSKWLRPGSTTGEASVIITPANRVYSFSAEDPLYQAHANAFGCMMALEAGNDLSTAVRLASKILNLN